LIGLDTNVLVRYVMQDGGAQATAATRLIESLTSDDRGFVPIVALVEFGWVLESVYERSRDEIADGYDEDPARARVGRGERRGGVARTASLRPLESRPRRLPYRKVRRRRGLQRTMTFDRKAARDCGMTLVAA
jgi:predicted nucleic-acid-binding protein